MVKARESGFTIVEVVVTMVILGAFIALFGQMYLVMESQRILVQRRATASDIAYKNLRKFPTAPVIDSLVCTTQQMNTRDFADATKGLLLGDQTNVTAPSTYGFVAESTRQLGKGVTQKVVAYAPFGCDDAGRKMIQIVSTVRFNGEDIRHVSYIQV